MKLDSQHRVERREDGKLYCAKCNVQLTQEGDRVDCNSCGLFGWIAVIEEAD